MERNEPLAAPQKCGANEAINMAGGLTVGVRARFAQADRYDLFAALLVAALLAFALLSFRDYAISNDEEVQHRYGELILSYYASGFTDLSLFQYKNLYLYGGLFDIVAVLLGRVLPADIFVIRHLLCALIGIGGIVATWATARLIAGPRAGALAAAGARGLRSLDRRHVQPHQGRSVRRRDDRRDLFPAARRRATCRTRAGGTRSASDCCSAWRSGCGRSRC